MRLSAVKTRSSDCESTRMGEVPAEEGKGGKGEDKRAAFISFKHALNKTGLSREAPRSARAVYERKRFVKERDVAFTEGRGRPSFGRPFRRVRMEDLVRGRKVPWEHSESGKVRGKLR